MPKLKKTKKSQNIEEEQTEKFDSSLIVIKEKKHVWVTKAIAEDGPRDFFLHVTLTETIEFLLILIIITLIAIGSMSTSMYYLTKIMKSQFIETEFETASGKDITFDDIKNAADFWAYLEHAATDSFYWDYWYDHQEPIAETKDEDNNIVYENRLLGVPRLRQIKVRNDTCQIFGTFQRSITECFGPFSSSNEDKEPFGLQTGTAWTYSKNEDTAFPFGRLYNGGYYQDLTRNRNETLDLISELKENLWITRGTRFVFLDFTVYNANMNFFCVVQLKFEFPTTGGVLPSNEFHTIKLLRYTRSWDYVILGLELIFYVYTTYMAAIEIREIVYLKMVYFKQFWNYIDMSIIIVKLTFFWGLIAIYRYILVKNLLIAYQSKPESYVDFYRVARVQITFNTLLAVILFLIYMKLFKYITFNKMMAQLNNTIKNCVDDVAGFSVMFFIIFIAFAELGYLLFGTQVTSFSTFGISMFTLLRTILGDFDYGEIEAIDRILAPIFFLSFIVLVFFILLNMFLAIINDTYTDVKTELTVAPDEMQMQQYLKRGYFNLLRWCKCKDKTMPHKEIQNEFDVTIEEIRGALKKCGFSDLEIEMFFSKYNVDRNAELGDYTVNDLLQELERKPERARGTYSPERPKKEPTDGTPLVAINDFVMQQTKLDNIEDKIETLIEQVKTVLNKLDSLENVRKTPQK